MLHCELLDSAGSSVATHAIKLNHTDIGLIDVAESLPFAAGYGANSLRITLSDAADQARSEALTLPVSASSRPSKLAVDVK